jgi:hypothetical protein
VLGRFLQTDPVGYAAGANLYAYVENDPLNLTDPYGMYALQFGFAISVSAFDIVVPLSAGVVIDTQGSGGVYGSAGYGLQVGASAQGSLSIQVSNARTIYDLSGPFSNLSAHGGVGLGGSIDYFTGPSSNGPVTGGGVTLGVAAGVSASIAVTSTTVCGLSGCIGSMTDLGQFLPDLGIGAAAAQTSTSPASQTSTPPK